MELTLAKCQTILDTLPIGYYIGRRVNVMMDEKADVSTYSPLEDTIRIAYKQIARRAKFTSENTSEEEVVRSMLYHEISHALLSTDHEDFFKRDDNSHGIFEDERIETVLKDYYIGVDFKKQLKEIHGNMIPPAMDKDSAFFNAVRFRIAPERILDKIDGIISRFGSLNRTTPYNPEWIKYCRAVEQLYEEITKDFPKNESAYNPPPNSMGGEAQNMDRVESQKQNGNGEGQENNSEQQKGEGENQNGEGENQNGENQNQNGEGEANGENSEQQSEIYKGDPFKTDPCKNREQMRKAMGACVCTKPTLSENEQKQLVEFTRTVEMIIANFNKKNSGGSGINAYSGVFNPRAVARNDYRYFDRSMSMHGNNRFGTCHLNLFIDASGSMHYNERIVNGIIASLTEVERKNSNFTMDISFIDHEYRDCETIRDRVYCACGGNAIPKDMKERFLKRQLPNTCNYNIILFDGDAICNSFPGMTEAIRRFGAFDYKQTTLITDPSNEKYLGNGFKSAKVVITRNYTAELIDHITKALMVAFG